VTQVYLYDTTLRDGMGGHGMSLSAAEKVRVVHALDRLGVHFIEAGFPASNPKEAELFEILADEELEQAQVCAFGMTRRRDVAAADDPALHTLVSSFAPVCTLVGKTWALHLEKVTRVSRDENLAMIRDSIAFLAGEGKRVLYDAEHFFDAWRDDGAYAIECLGAAVEGGAENVTLCDTNGATLPRDVERATAAALEALDADDPGTSGGPTVGIHTHNDAECAVANTLAAVGSGATLVQGTANGYGERCGNANLFSILPALQLKLGLECVPAERIARLTETAHLIDEICNLTPDPDQPYVGRNAFAHKAGMHAAGVQADTRTFEHLDPRLVGNSREVLISELSGRGSVISHAERAGIELDEGAAVRAVERVKDLEHRGYQYEAADASFELLLRREAGEYESLFRLESFRVVTEKRADGGVETEATVKIWVDGQRFLRTAEGNGPVNALDRALRDAITEQHPHLADIELINYKVRILDERHGTGAVTRVLLDSSDGTDEWGSIGVSENIIEASWEALVDSLEYAFQPKSIPLESSAPAHSHSHNRS
jgi:2-isopropylmalate synthase